MSVYRVIVCEDNDGQFFIDICFAQHQTHVDLLEMRKELNPNVSWLENVYLKDKGDGVIALNYVKHHNRRLQEQQEKLRGVADSYILMMYQDMQKKGKSQTIEKSNGGVSEIIRQPKGLNGNSKITKDHLSENCR